jgi:outer membrane immunogenic protein
MKKYFLASVALVLSMGVAHAGEAKFDGAYVGGQASYSKADIDATVPGVGSGTVDGDGFGGGLFGGYGKTFGNWYVGGELSADYSKLEGSANGIDGSVKKEFGYGAAVRGGYLVTPKVLAYGVVGIERGKFKAKDDLGDSLSGYLTGYRVGAGAETFLTDNVSARAEINYIDWQDKGIIDGAKEWRANVGVAYHF